MPRLADLFCCAGGAGEGYARAGFEVVGVDIEPRPNYPYEFHQADALTFPLDDFDAIHASPPCHAFSRLRHLHKEKEYPDLLAATRGRLTAAGVPYVIENVPGAPLIHPVLLCGSMFGLGAAGRQLRRHRLFECSFTVPRPPCRHIGEPIGVYGEGGRQKSWSTVARRHRGYIGSFDERQEAMGIDWMTRQELSQAIPPAYTKYLGGWLLSKLTRSAHAAS